MSPQSLQALLEEGVASGVFPMARAEVWLKGKPVFEGGTGAEDALFDLASVTKVMATTALFARFWEEGKLTPLSRVRELYPESTLEVTLADLLYHRSGLPGFAPLFENVLSSLLKAQVSEAAREQARKKVVHAVATHALAWPTGQSAVYSDLGFILLGEALARVGGRSLDVLFVEQIAQPLGLSAHFRRLSHKPVESQPIPPTGAKRPREPAPGQAHTWKELGQMESQLGEVDDDNAWAMDGVAGHAGLFGTVSDVARFGVLTLEELAGTHRIASQEKWEQIVRKDAHTPDSTRALGFDTPSAMGSAAGKYVGKLPPGAFGHMGFTGISLWVDRARELVIALCSNRTWLGRANTAIQTFRPRFQDAVVESLGL